MFYVVISQTFHFKIDVNKLIHLTWRDMAVDKLRVMHEWLKYPYYAFAAERFLTG